MSFCGSCAVNFTVSKILENIQKRRKLLLMAGVAANTVLLLYFKYTNFVIATINEKLGREYTLLELALPLGISFFTFQQIMFIVGVYRKEIAYTGIIDYLSYALYFPKLVMGPIVEPNDLLGQFHDDSKKDVDWDNIASGIKLFCFGFFKKMVMADTFARGVSWGYGNIDAATAGDFILVMLFYTFEIYFDFNGYTDMAAGISKMLNIDLPINFDSPYKALSVRDFWKRWHISLTSFFTKYVYIPLGGNRKGKIREYINIMAVFLISGLWHGANWTFIIWGGIHGALQIFERIFGKHFQKVFVVARWLYTFAAVNVLWLLFRSDSITQWHVILYRILTFQNLGISDGMVNSLVLPESAILFEWLKLGSANSLVRGFSLLLFTAAGFFICLVPENNYKTQKVCNAANVVLAAVAFVWSILCLSDVSVFVYFNF